MTGLAGTVRWAVVPYSPEAPFRIYAGSDRAPYELGLRQILDSALAGADRDVTFLTTGNARPILVLSDPPENLDPAEVTGLRLRRFSYFTATERDTIRAQRDNSLFYLRPDRIKLEQENAAMISSIVRINVNAISAESLGELTIEEMRVLGERIIRFYNFNTDALVHQRLQELAARRRRGL